jgi:UDP-glucuronate decarboxylase
MRSTILAEDVGLILKEMAQQLQALGGSTLLLTGGSGFLCSYFVDLIAALNDRGLSSPCRLLVVDNLRTGVSSRLQRYQERSDIQILLRDVTLPLQIDEPVRWIIHGASIASPTFYRRYPLETIDANVTGTRNLLEFAHNARVRSMLYLSTSEIYGDPPASCIPTGEDYRGNVACLGPRACYDESKRLGETLCFVFHQRREVPVKIVRPFNVYGPGQRLDDRRIIPDLLSAALRRQALVLYSTGKASRAFCYITDAVRAMLYVLLSDANGEAFNVGNDAEEISISGLAEKVREAAGPPRLAIEYHTSDEQDYLTDNPQRRCPDLTKLRSLCSWQPHVSLAEGLRRTLRSYQEAASA